MILMISSKFAVPHVVDLVDFVDFVFSSASFTHLLATLIFLILFFKSQWLTVDNPVSLIVFVKCTNSKGAAEVLLLNSSKLHPSWSHALRT